MGKQLTYTIRTFEEMQGALARMASAIGRGIERAPVEVSLRHQEDKRSLQANRLMWKLLNDISRQVEWCGQYHEPETWKDLITALMKKQTLLPGLDGGFVAIGTSTRKMRKAEFSDLIECIYSVGAERNVQWSADTSIDWDAYKEARAA